MATNERDPIKFPTLRSGCETTTRSNTECKTRGVIKISL